MSNLNFLHFDTALKDVSSDDPFNCSLTLANPLRGVRRIYLKSCEIPIGYFNIRESYNFSFNMKIPVSAYKTQTVTVYINNINDFVATPLHIVLYGGGGLIATPTDGPNTTPTTTTIQQPIVSPLTGGKNYNWSPEAVNNYLINGIVPVNGGSYNKMELYFQLKLFLEIIL
jgi:hypothetical protein